MSCLLSKRPRFSGPFLYFKNMAKLTEKIECVDCGAERMITKACFGMVKRCKSCQKKFNRNKARERYRKMKGIPLDKPVTNVIKPKKEKKKETEAKSAGTFFQSTPVPRHVSSLTEEEKKIRNEKVAKLLDLLPDKSTDEDW